MSVACEPLRVNGLLGFKGFECCSCWVGGVYMCVHLMLSRGCQAMGGNVFYTRKSLERHRYCLTRI